MMFWWFVKLVTTKGERTRGVYRLKIGPFDLLTSVRTEANRMGWLLNRGKGSELFDRQGEPLFYGKKIRQLIFVVPESRLRRPWRIFEKYEPEGGDV